MRRRDRRSKQQLDGLEERRVYCKLKQEALDCPLWGGYRPVVRERGMNISFTEKRFLQECILCAVTAGDVTCQHKENFTSVTVL
jgi:hypothetical protein